jgi:hypothetical protein
MKIGEALAEKKRMQNDLAKVNELIRDNFTYRKGEKPDFNFNKLTKEQDRLIKQILKIKLDIQRTNATIKISWNGKKHTLQESIIILGDLRSNISTLNSLYNSRDRMWRHDDDVEMISQVPMNEIQEKIRALTKEKTELDSLLQHTNWTTDII